MIRRLAFPLAALAATFALAAHVFYKAVDAVLGLADHLFPATAREFIADYTPRSIFETRRAGLA